MDNQSQPLTPQGQGLPQPQPPIIPSSPPTQPLSNIPLNSNPQNTQVIFGQNDNYKTPKENRFKLWFIISGIVFFILLIGAATYLWILPTRWANIYINNTKPLYLKQSSQMTTAFESLGRPVFNEYTTVATDKQDFAYISNALTIATNSTNTLKAKNHLTVLLGTTWLHKVSTTNTEYQAMQQYVSDSQIFLSDYKELLIYAEQIEQVGQVQLPPLANDFDAIEATTNNSALLAALQQTTTDLQNFSDQVKGLKPSPDLTQFNEDLLSDLSGMNSSLQGLVSALQGNISANISDLFAELETSFSNFIDLLNTNPTANIQTNSIINGQITSLEAEHPFK
jgi:hypothetical protein